MKDDKMMKKDKMMKDDKMMMKDNPMVGGAAMYRNKNIVENAVNSKDHTTLVAAVKAAGLVDTLSSGMALTVFAPENSAFAALPAGTVDTLLKPENIEMLKKILTYHVIVGNLDSTLIMKAIERGNGKATFITVSGDGLTMMMEGGKLVLMDEKGGKSTVTIADVRQSNGYIHSIDSVLIPN
jgi:uncharacterized surface protein with fasciclin (FAS1) repeats